MAVPLVYWGYCLLAGGIAAIGTVAFQRHIEENEVDIRLPDVLGGSPEPEPEPEREVDLTIPRNAALREATRQLVETQTRARRRCEDDSSEDCGHCRPAIEGSEVFHDFQAGTVRHPSPRGMGSLFQHYVVPWFQMTAREVGTALRVNIEEWEWRRGREGSWDGLDFEACRLIECKLGYLDFMDPALVGNRGYDRPNPQKPFLGTLQREFGDQLEYQVGTIRSADPPPQLEWVFSDHEVMWQFVTMVFDLGFYEVQNRRVDFSPLAPNGTLFVRRQFTDGPEPFGYWEDV